MVGIENIGARIKHLREKENLSQAAFAKKIDVSPGNVGDWESPNKKSMPGAKAIHAISCEFKVSADWILNGDDYSIGENTIPEQEPLDSYESELLNLFRILSPRDQGKIVGYMESAIEKQDKKANLSKSAHGEDAATTETA